MPSSERFTSVLVEMAGESACQTYFVRMNTQRERYTQEKDSAKEETILKKPRRIAQETKVLPEIE